MTTGEVVVGPEVGEVTGIDTVEDDGEGIAVVMVSIVATGSEEPVEQAATNMANAVMMASLRLISR